MDVVAPFINAGLHGGGSFESESMVTVSVGVVVDICGAIEGEIQKYSDGIMEVLTNCLRSQDVVRDVKPHVISAFGDMALAVKGGYEPYMPSTMMLLMQASQQSAESQEMVEFINSLRLSILEAYSGIVIGMSEGNMKESLHSHLPAVLQFVSMLATDTTKDDAILKKAVELVGDLGQELGAAVKPHLHQQFVEQLLQQAGNSQDESVRESARWSFNVVNAL
jgi:importin subunit beta-1